MCVCVCVFARRSHLVFQSTSLSHAGYKYRLLLVQCYILPLGPHPVPSLAPHGEYDHCSDVLLTISDNIIKSQLPQQRLPESP